MKTTSPISRCTAGTASHFCRFFAGTVFLFLCLSCVKTALAEELTRLQRLEIHSQASSTRIELKLNGAANYRVVQRPDRVQLTLQDTDGPLYRRFHSYGDSHIIGIHLSQRGNDLRITIGTRQASPSVLVRDQATGILTVQVGRPEGPSTPAIAQGREPILQGAARLVSDFDPPLRAEIPFVPTDPGQLQKVAAGDEVTLFQRGESSLYKENGAEAAEIFAWFTGRDTPLRPLAWYRQGEALYLLGRYDAALKAFREGIARWPAYLELNPETSFYYADSLARMGSLADGRKMLAHLIARLADKAYAPLLLDRLADVLARSGNGKEAETIYRTVIDHFPDSKAAHHARLKRADRSLFSFTPDTYRYLVAQYQDIYRAAADPALRDDAHFKSALVESLYGQAPKALAVVTQYEKLFPQGTFVTIARSLRQELLLQVYQDLYLAKDWQGLITLAVENRDYLGRCFSDERFIHRLADVFAAMRRPAGKVQLFNQLVEREWTAGAAPFIYGEIVDGAIRIGDLAMADLTAANFMRRFPGHPETRHMLEHRGEIAFLKKDLPKVVAELSWLLNPRGKPVDCTSYFYLGKALTAQKDYKNGERMLAEYVGCLGRTAGSSPFAGDAYFSLGTACKGRREFSGAMAAYRAGLARVDGPMKDQFLYAMGEVCVAMKNASEAKSYWSRIVKEGSDPVWRRMAEQGLGDLEWQERTETLYRVVK